MAMDFPASPSVNDRHQVGAQIWFWNGTYWELKSNATKFSSQDAAPSTPLAGDVWYETDTGKLFIQHDSYWVEIGHASDGQSFIVSDTTPASTTTGDIWYESDTGKTFIYYDSYWVEIGHASDADVSAYAPLASPTLTGTPLAPTASANTSTTQLATTEFVMTEVGDYVTTTTANSTYAPKASPEFTGNVTMQSLDMDDIVAGDVIYGSGADTLARLAKGSNDEVLTLASGIPSWAAIPAAASDEIVDADSDTKIQVEESADEDKIRFDVAGTQVATMTADGLLFGTDTAATNALHDYEEGTWTASFTLQSGTVTVSPNTGRYTKIGREVFLSGRVTISAISSPSGWAKFTGLPFTSLAGAGTENYSTSIVSVIGLANDVDPGYSDAIVFNNAAEAWMATMDLDNQNSWNATQIEVGTIFDFHGNYSTAS